MHDDRTQVEGRLERALRQFVRPARYAAREPLALSVLRAGGEPVAVAGALTGAYTPFEVGTEWGPPWSTSWFRLEGTVPHVRRAWPAARTREDRPRSGGRCPGPASGRAHTWPRPPRRSTTHTPRRTAAAALRQGREGG